MHLIAPRIRHAIQAVLALRQHHAASLSLRTAVLEVKRLQAQRFRATYTDPLQDASYRVASLLCLDEFYCDRDYERCDQQLACIANTIGRLFPVTVTDTAAILAEVHA